MAAIVASKVKRIRKQRDADSQQNLRTTVVHGNSQFNSRGRGDSLFENGGEASPSSIKEKQNVVQRQVTLLKCSNYKTTN